MSGAAKAIGELFSTDLEPAWVAVYYEFLSYAARDEQLRVSDGPGGWLVLPAARLLGSRRRSWQGRQTVESFVESVCALVRRRSLWARSQLAGDDRGGVRELAWAGFRSGQSPSTMPTRSASRFVARNEVT
jgi:hypothetical protein